MTKIPNHTCFDNPQRLAEKLHEDEEGLLEWEVKQCPTCAQHLDQLERWCEEMENSMWIVGSEAAYVHKLAARLLKLPQEKQLQKVDSDEAYHHWGLVQLYLKDSEAHRLSDFQRSFDRAQVAVRIVEGIANGFRLDPYDPQWVTDLRAKAWAYLANGWRLLRDFSRAEQAFLEADAFVAQGTRSGRARAYVLTLRASLLTDQYREVEAAALLEQAIAIHKDRGDDPARGRALMQLAYIWWHLGETQEAIRLAEESLPLLPTESLRLYTCLNLATYALDLDDPEAAEGWLERISADAERPLLARAAWVASRIARARGDWERALELLGQARRALAAEELGYELALASLDWAFLEQGRRRTGRVREVIDEALPLLLAQGLPHEAFAALRLVYDASARDRLTLGLLREVTWRLERIHRPEPQR